MKKCQARTQSNIIIALVVDILNRIIVNSMNNSLTTETMNEKKVNTKNKGERESGGENE